MKPVHNFVTRNTLQELLDKEYQLLDYEESDSCGNNSKEKENSSSCYYSDSPAESLQDGIQIGDLDQEQQFLEKNGTSEFQFDEKNLATENELLILSKGNKTVGYKVPFF